LRPTTLEFCLQLSQLARPKFTAQANSRSNWFNLQRHQVAAFWRALVECKARAFGNSMKMEDFGLAEVLSFEHLLCNEQTWLSG
jgi:hypothetical protein